MALTQFSIVGLGEVLWDVFPTHKQLGGAPANFAYISSLLGEDAIVASRVGTDAFGDEVVERLNLLDLRSSHLQRDAVHPTGTVKVEVANDGQPRFEITLSVAWDFLEWTPELEALAARADAVCFGSLAQREPQSRTTIQRFISSTRPGAIRIFDVNLRQAFFSPEILVSSAESADILKLNHEEVPAVLKTFGAHRLEERSAAEWMCERFALKLVCITRGGAGSLLVSPTAHHEHPGFSVKVADTVGAGDAFTAALVHHYLRGSSLSVMNEAANRMGAWVASQPGATPAMDANELAKVRVPSR
jgi:fructokinase